MTSLLAADPERVLRCALTLDVLSDEVRACATGTRFSIPRGWHSPAGVEYAVLLDETRERLRRVSDAYGSAGDVLLPYARALADAQELARQAARLAQEAESALVPVFSIAALLEPDPGAELRAVAARLLGEAVEIERAAAAACGAALRDLAARAPASSRWASTSRFLGDVAQSVGGAAAGLAGVIGSGVHALPFVGNGRGRHNARHELAESALAMMRVWETPVEMWQAVMDDRAGLTAGTFAAAALPVGKFRIHNPNLAHREALAEAARRSILQGHVQTTPSISTLLRDGVSLVNEEARGGHAWSRHVAKPRSFLAYRTRGGIPKAGTFRDLPTAERLVNTVLREHADRLHEVYALRGRARLTLISEFPFTTGRVTVVGSSRTLPAKAVKVVLVLQDGDPLVYTAFPEL